MSRRRTTALKLVLALTSVILAGLSACRTSSGPAFDTWEGGWAEYVDARLGIRFHYPDVLVRELDETGEVVLSYRGACNVRVVFVDESVGRERGLWFGHQAVSDESLGGRSAQKYVYDHYDGPFAVRTVSYVVPYRDRYLGIEFRPGGMPQDARGQLLETFEFLETSAGGAEAEG